MAEPNEPPFSPGPPEDFFHRHLDLIERIAAGFARRSHLRPQDAGEFLSYVYEKLLEDDYRRLLAYRGRCQPARFFAVTIGRLGHDFLDKLLGSWHPSAEARRLGRVAILLEALLHRDRRTFDEACEELWTRHRVEETREELEKIQKALPKRPPHPIKVGEVGLPSTAGGGPTPEELALEREKQERRNVIRGHLQTAIETLPPAQRLLLRLHWADGFSVAKIARVRNLDQKALYRELEKAYRHLRKVLTELGVSKEEIDDLF